MQAIRENAKYKNSETVWAGKYKNSQNLSHWHYDCELLYVIEGELEVMCDKKWYSISKGDTFFINSEQVHFMHARTEDTIIIVINFDYGIIHPFTYNLTLFTPILSRTYGIPEVYEKLKKELGAKQSFYENKTAYIIAQVMIDIFREEKVVPKTKEKPVTEQFKRLLEDINENYEFYTFETAANFMHMAPTYFSRFFHNTVGMTFSMYLNHIKIIKTIETMRQNPTLSMTEVALQCGFSTIRNFNKTFKRFTGYSPTHLPAKFILQKQNFVASETNGNPTLPGCELIECCNNQ